MKVCTPEITPLDLQDEGTRTNCPGIASHGDPGFANMSVDIANAGMQE